MVVNVVNTCDVTLVGTRVVSGVEDADVDASSSEVVVVLASLERVEVVVSITVLDGGIEVGGSLVGVDVGVMLVGVEVVDSVVSDVTPVDRFTDCLRKSAIASSRGSATTFDANKDDNNVTEMILKCFMMSRICSRFDGRKWERLSIASRSSQQRRACDSRVQLLVKIEQRRQ